MNLPRANIIRAALLTLGLLILPADPASAQFLGGYGGYGGYGYGGLGYGGYGGYGAGGLGGYGGFGGYGGGGFGGYGGGGFGGYGGYNLLGYNTSYYGAYSNAFGLGGVGYPGIAALNPYFSFGLSPLAVENAIFERRVLGRTLPATPSPRVNQVMARPQVAAPVGTGTFSPPQ